MLLFDEIGIFERTAQYNVEDIVKDLAHIVRVRGRGDVDVDLLARYVVQRLVFGLHKIPATFVVEAAIVVREGDLEVRALHLLPEQVVLVEEEDHRQPAEPTGVADLLEERCALVRPAHRIILVQELIVFAHGDAKEDRCHVLEAVKPLASL